MKTTMAHESTQIGRVHLAQQVRDRVHKAVGAAEALIRYILQQIIAGLVSGVPDRSIRMSPCSGAVSTPSTARSPAATLTLGVMKIGSSSVVVTLLLNIGRDGEGPPRNWAGRCL